MDIFETSHVVIKNRVRSVFQASHRHNKVVRVKKHTRVRNYSPLNCSFEDWKFFCFWGRLVTLQSERGQCQGRDRGLESWDSIYVYIIYDN